MCVFVCAPPPRAQGIKTTAHTHTHGAQHAIWLPCTRRSTRCGSFNMPISCRAYWLNRAPARLTDSAQTQPKPQLSFSSATTTATTIAASSAAAVAASSGSVVCITLAIRIWNSAQQFVCRISPASLMKSDIKMHGWWHIFCIHNTTFSRNKCGSCACAWSCFAAWCSKKREMQIRKIKDWKKSFQISLYHIQ